MRRFCLFLSFVLSGLIAIGQDITVSGKVTNSAGAGVEGINVQVKGTKKGTITQGDGTYSIGAPATGTLVFSGVGFATQEVAVAGKNAHSITLAETSTELNNVVVTALGINKQARKVGYAVTTVDGGQMNKARETNVALSLAGQVAGLNVHGTSGGPGGSARILLRGAGSLTASGPLFVINGVPMDNTQKGSAGEWGGADNGDGIGNLNPDDIETMTVLKGQSASALYGARASNGVILITTKTGKKGSLTVDYNMNLVVDKAVDFTDYQYEYGQGIGGVKPTNATDAQTTARMSWGAKLDGSQITQFDGKQYAYSAVTDNISRFYRTAPAFTNTIAVSRGTETGSFRFSGSNLDAKSILRNSGMDRKTFNLNLDQKITSKLSISLMANYLYQQDKNKAQLSDGPMNANNGMFLATNIDEAILAPGYNTTTGAETVFSDDIYVTNPWFVVNQYVNNINRKRLISSFSAKYYILPWMYAMGRIGYDNATDNYFRVEPWGTAYTTELRGNLQEQSKAETMELNMDAILGINKKIGSDFNIDALLGGNIRRNQFEKVGINGSRFVVPYQYSYNNVQAFGRTYNFNKREVHSGFYSLDLGYKEFLTLSTTGRYDEYSTVYNSSIPTKDRGIFTPSVSASLLFSELLHAPKLSFGKLRMSYAQTSGEPGSAYQTAVTYSIGNTLNGLSTGSFSSTMPNALLKPFVTTEFEVGTEVKFFKNRLGFDLSFYTKKTKNEILSATFSPSTGYTNGYVATGSTQNKGLEALVTGTPVSGKNFTWNVSFNLTSLKNKVLETNEEGGSLTLGAYRPLNANTYFVKGMAGPQIQAYDYKYDTKGNIVVDAAGIPLRGNLIAMGSVLPTLYGGLKNEFNYKGVSLDILADYNFGNKILSASNFYAIRRGLHQMTLEGREGGVTKGVKEDGSVNTTAASAQDYYMGLAQNVSKVNVLDGDFIKLRQITLGYTFSGKQMAKVPLFQSIQFSVVGRNLWVIMKKSDNIDPEAGFSSVLNYAGIEGTSLPTTRSIGFNLNFKFK